MSRAYLSALVPTLVLLLCTTAPAVSDPSRSTHVIRVAAQHVPQVTAAGISPIIDLDYGSYRWLEVHASDLSKLAAAGIDSVEVRDAGQIRVLDHHFDPLLEGEPRMALGMEGSPAGQGLRLVQFQGPTRGDWLAQLEARGVKVLQYYPHNTYLVWAGETAANGLATLDFVRWQGLFHPGYKISRGLRELGPRLDFLSVFLYNDGRVGETVSALKRLGAEVVQHVDAQPDGQFQTVLARADVAALDQMAALPAVVWLGYRSPERQLDDEMSDQIVAGNHPGGEPIVGYQSHLASLGYDGTGVVWAIADTGVDFDHPELGSRIVGGWSGAGACSPAGSDCASGGHGTHVAGITGGDGSTAVADGDGFLCGLGVAPNFSIFAMNIFFGSDPLQEISKQAVLGGAIGSNNSWAIGPANCGDYGDSERTYDFMVRDGNFDTPAVEPHIVVFSAGNSGPGACTLTQPKQAKSVIVTGGTQNYRVASNIDAMYISSSRGPTADGRIGPTIVTPGQSIYSTRNDLGGSCAASVCGGSLHSTCSGTSMAAPHASGTVVLLAEWWKDNHGGANPSPAMAKSLLVNSAVDISGAADIPNNDEGWGRVEFTSMIDSPTQTFFLDQTEIFDSSGQEWTLEVQIDDPSKPLKVTLAWSDAPGAIGANPALVNNLDLEIDHDGSTYKGNVFSGGWSTTGGSADALETLENVFIQSPTTTTATVTVKATSVAADGVPGVGSGPDQDFALVCSNCLAPDIFADGFESGDTDAW